MRGFSSLRRLRTAARVQPAADDSEALARRGGSELAGDVLYAELHELAAGVYREASVLATELAAQVQHEASELAAEVCRKAS